MLLCRSLNLDQVLIMITHNKLWIPTATFNCQQSCYQGSIVSPPVFMHLQLNYSQSREVLHTIFWP
jgi:hypothetical protein